ncbi:MAG: polysaccharide pyruvyl transferase CsaB [Oscillospiraceae bacterium]|nr:polysaccharide pyruvyl transferase CsaB [Oscillospiraceae bacterium]
MKILTLISGGDIGGAKTHVLTLLRELSKTAGILLVCFMEGEFSDEAREMGIDTLVLRDGGIFGDLKRLEEICAEGGFDLIHSHGSRGNFMAALLKRRVRLPLLTTVHSDYRLDYMGRPLAGLIYGTLNRLALRKMDYYTGVSDAMAELLISRGMQPDRVFTIYNGIDLDAPLNSLPPEEFLAKYSVKYEKDCFYAGIAARLNPVKDIATLIRGFALAAEKEPRLRLLIAGEGQEEAALKELALRLSVADKVHFLGWVGDTDSFYNALDVNTLTSLSETFPYALTEGVRLRLPTVSSRVGGVPRLIDDGVNGLLFEAGDEKGLAEALLRMARDESFRTKSADSLYEKTRRLFSLEATCRTQKEIYSSVIRRSRRQGDRRGCIAVCGAYGRGNAGDEAILKAVLAEIREQDPDAEIYVLSKNPAETRMMHRVRAVHTYSVVSFALLAGRLKLYINGGGSLIQDVTSRRSLWFYLYTLAAAKKRRARVLMYGCGIGPVNYASDRRLAASIINKYVDAITLREDGSLEELKSMGVTKPEIYLAADPALTLTPAPAESIDSTLLRAGIDPAGKYVCFALRPWSGFSERAADIAAAADELYFTDGLTPVFLSIDRIKDGAAAAEVTRRMKAPYGVLDGGYDAGTVIGVMARMRAVVSMRLHALIFAAGHGVPLIGIVYDPKVSAFLRYIGREYFTELENVSEARLLELVRGCIAENSGSTQRLAVEKLRDMEKVNRDVLKRYMS